MNKIALTVLITGILATSIIAIIYLESSNTKNEEAPLLWETSLEHFATDITVADGKVFTTNSLISQCFNLTNGNSLWNASIHRNDGIEFYQNNVYIGSVGGIVNKLDKDTGEVLAQFPAPVSSSIGSKTSPDFFLADNKLFTSRDGVAVYDVKTEELFWENNRNLVLTLGNASLNVPESNYIYIKGNARYNPNNGSLIWNKPGWQDNPPIITQKQVIFWNYNSECSDFRQNILSVNASTGETIWNYDVEASVFQPVSYNEILLFGSNKGYFYALNITDGSLVWKIHIDTNHLMLNYTSLDAPSVYVDSQNQRAYWGFIVAQNDGSQGELSCLDISTGNLIWTEQFLTNGSADVGSLVSLKNTIFFTANNHLWTFNKQTGNLTDVKTFDHYILPPVEYDNKVFIAADLFLFAYE